MVGGISSAHMGIEGRIEYGDHPLAGWRKSPAPEEAMR
jgi:hypothetical protein